MAQNQTHERDPAEKQRDKPRLDKLPFLFISPGIWKKTRTETQCFRSPQNYKPEKGETRFRPIPAFGLYRPMNAEISKGMTSHSLYF